MHICANQLPSFAARLFATIACGDQWAGDIVNVAETACEV
jgi:hypothetical protein